MGGVGGGHLSIFLVLAVAQEISVRGVSLRRSRLRFLFLLFSYAFRIRWRRYRMTFLVHVAHCCLAQP